MTGAPLRIGFLPLLDYAPIGVAILGNTLWMAGARDAPSLSTWMAAHPDEKPRLGYGLFSANPIRHPLQAIQGVDPRPGSVSSHRKRRWW